LPLPLPLSLPLPPPRLRSSPLSPLDLRMNPGVEDLARLWCERMLIFVAEEDYLSVATKNYYEKLKRSG